MLGLSWFGVAFLCGVIIWFFGIGIQIRSWWMIILGGIAILFVVLPFVSATFLGCSLFF